MTPQWRGAIVGFGQVASQGHWPAWHRQPDFRIVAVCEPDPMRQQCARETIPSVRLYDSLEELLAREDVDFVDIATPPAMHAAQVLAAARARVHVLCEKPLTTSFAEFEEMQRAVRAAGVVLHTVHNWRFSEAFRALRAEMQREEFGALHSITLETLRAGCAPGAGGLWRLDAGLAGGGILVDHGWHAFYLMAELAGEPPRTISASVERQCYLDAPVEDTARCRLAFSSCVGKIHLTWAATTRRTVWHIAAEHGELRLENSRLFVRGRKRERQLELPSPAVGSHHPDWFDGVIGEFRSALRAPELTAGNIREAGLCVALLEHAYRSAEENGRTLSVQLPRV